MHYNYTSKTTCQKLSGTNNKGIFSHSIHKGSHNYPPSNIASTEWLGFTFFERHWEGFDRPTESSS